MKAKKTKKTETVVPFAEESTDIRTVHDLETAITQADLRKLSEFAYFFEAAVDAFFAWDSKAVELEGRTVSALLRPMVEEFHHFVHVTLDDERDSWYAEDRMKVLGPFHEKVRKLAQVEGGAA